MNYLLGFSDLLLFQSSSCCNISPLWHLQSCIFPALPLSLCMIASSDRSSSPSLPLYLCLHCLTLSSFVHLLFSCIFHHQPAINHQHSSPPLYVILSPQPSFLLLLYHHLLPAHSLLPRAAVCLCVRLFLRDRLIRTLLILMERRCCCFRDGGTGKVKGSTSAVVNWQHVDQTGLNQNHSPLSAAQNTQFSCLLDNLASPFISEVNLLSLKIVSRLNSSVSPLNYE